MEKQPDTNSATAAPRSEDDSIFARYIQLEGDPTLPVTSGSCIGKALRMKHFHQVPDSEEALEQVQHATPNYIVDSVTCNVYATTLGILHIEDDKIILRPILYPSHDGMTVFADIYYKNYHGEPMLLEHYDSALHALNVTVPADAEKFYAALATSKNTETPVRMVPLCLGKHPTHEQEPTLLPLLPEKTHDIDTNSPASRNYKEQGFYAEIPAHTPVAVKIPAPEPSNGFDVFGNALPVIGLASSTPEELSPNHDNSLLRIGANLYGKLHHDGHTVYYSACSGLLSIRDDILSITDVLRIDGDVDITTGNICVQKGSVHITGSVTAGYKVEASQHVIIDGDLDKSNIVCGGDLFVSGAIIMNARTSVVCHGSVYAHHIHQGEIRAHHSIITTGSIINSKLIAGNAIRTCSDQGTVLGSTIVAGSEINIASAGGEQGTPPILVIATEAEAKKELRRTAKQTEHILSQSISKLDTWLRKNQKKEHSSALRTRAEKLLARAKKVRSSISKNLSPRITHPLNLIIIRGTVVGGTLLTMHGSTVTVEHTLPKLSMNLDQHQNTAKHQRHGNA